MPIVRVPLHIYDALHDLIAGTDESVVALLDRMIVQERDRRFWGELNAAHAALWTDAEFAAVIESVERAIRGEPPHGDTPHNQ